MISYELGSYSQEIKELDHPNVFFSLSSICHMYRDVNVKETFLAFTKLKQQFLVSLFLRVM